MLTLAQGIVSVNQTRNILEKKERILQKTMHKRVVIFEDEETIQITKGNEKISDLNEEKKKMEASLRSAENRLALIEDTPKPKDTHLSKSQLGRKMSYLSGSLLYGYRGNRING